MITFDKVQYDKAYFQSRHADYAKREGLDKPAERVVALCLKSSLEMIGAVLYLMENGGSVLLLNGNTPLVTATAIAERAGCSHLFYESIEHVLPLGGTARPDEPSLLQCSSGTTGEPKIIRRPWTEVDEEIEAYNRAVRWPDDGRPLILVPVFHSFGLIAGVLAAMARGVEPVVVTDRNPRLWAHLVKTTDRAIVYGVPFMFHVMMSVQKEPIPFHAVVSSGAPLTDALLGKLMSSSRQVYQQYGCTEVGCISIAGQPESASDVGKPLFHLNVCTKEHQRGYHEINVSLRNKILNTGDLGNVMPDGTLQVYGRLDDLISVAGLKVVPSEVERVIEGMPGVAEVVVHKTRHPVWGEAVKAVVVPVGRIDQQEVRDWCMRYLPPYKVPGTIELVAEIARPPSGKISRKFLSERDKA